MRKMSHHNSSYSILLVEDDPLGREIIQAHLVRLNIIAECAANGHEAVTKVSVKPYDLILMDVQMPGMNGLEATRAIRALDLEYNAKIPIIAISGNISPEDKQANMDAGINSCIDKPIEHAKLCAELQRWLPGLAIDMCIETPGTTGDSATDMLTELEAALPDIEVRKGISRSGGGVKEYVRMLHKFKRNFASTTQLVRAELDSGSTENAVRFVHTLKSNAGTLGAAALQLAATQLEEDFFRYGAAAKLGMLEHELERFMAHIEQLEPIYEDRSKKERGSMEHLCQILSDIIPLFDELQVSEAKHLLHKLKQHEWPGASSMELEQILDAADHYRYALASERARELLATLGSG